MSVKNDAEASEASEEGQPCRLCGEVPENIIFLSCGHTICLICMGRTVFESNQDSEQPVACPLCDQLTALSPELQEALAELFSSQNSDEESVPETSLLQGTTSLPLLSSEDKTSLRLFCSLHAGEEFVYYRPTDHRLLCPQCALTETASSSFNGLRPLRRCLPQVLESLRQPFLHADLEAKRIGLRCAEAEFRRQALVAEAEANYRRLEEELDGIAELARGLKEAAQRDFRTHMDVELQRISSHEEQLRQKRDFFREAAKQVEVLHESAGAEKLVAAFAFAGKLQHQLMSEEPLLSNDTDIENVSNDILHWTEKRTAQAHRALRARINPRGVSEELSSGTPRFFNARGHIEESQKATTLFQFRPNPNTLIARLQERARGRIPCGESSPFKQLFDANSTSASSGGVSTALKPRGDKLLTGRALVYSSLKRRELDAKLQAFQPLRSNPGHNL